jgi:chromosome segregation ATPase
VKELKAHYKPFKQEIDKMKKTVLNAEKGQLKPIEDAINSINTRMIEWKREEDRRIAEIERKAREEAERKRHELMKKAEEERLQQVIDSEDEDLLDMEIEVPDVQPVHVPEVKIERPSEPSGVSYREYWYHEVTDAEKVPDRFKIVNDKALAAYAKSMKDGAKVPGVRFYCEKKPVYR